MQLVEDRHHVRGPVRRPVNGYRVRIAKHIVGVVVGDLDVAPRIYTLPC